MAQRSSSSFLLFSGTSHEDLAKKVAAELKIELGKMQIKEFPDREIGVEILESVREKNIYVLQSTAKHPNHFLIELFIIIDALKRACSRSITLVMPYFGYARQDRRHEKKEPISARLFASLLEKAGANRIITVDLHAEQIEGFFEIPVRHISARVLFIERIKELSLQKPIIVAPDVGRAKLASRFAKDLDCEIAIVEKRRVSGSEVEALSLIGNVEGKDVIIVDDIGSTGKTLYLSSELCKKAQARSIYACITHALFVGAEWQKAQLDGLFVTDSLPHVEGVETISLSLLLAEAIGKMEENKFLKRECYETDSLSTF